MKDKSMLLLGVDGGGTKTTVAACDCSGEYLGSVSCGSINYNAVGMKKARENMAAGIDGILQKTGLTDYRFLTIGHSALDDVATDGEKTAFAETIIDKDKLYMLSDADVALKGGTLGSCGMLIISGTGSIGMAIDKTGKKYVAGGWGYLLYDEGSGFAIGMNAIKSAVKNFERGVAAPLERAVKAHFNVNDLRAAIPIIYADGFLPSSIAALATDVSRIAEAGDPEANRILKDAAGELAALVFSLFNQSKGALDGAPIYVYGSILQKCQIVRTEFERLVRERYPNTPIASPRLNAECGSLIFSAEKCGLLNEVFLQTLEKTYAESKN
jgi:N-acetylglucosamine kinase-like BadF-type ATPase